MKFKKEGPFTLSSAKHGATVSQETLERMRASKQQEMIGRGNPMQERLKGKIEEATAQELQRVKAQLELTQQLSRTQGIVNEQLQRDNRKQDEVIDYLLQALLDSGVELPQRAQELLADRVEKKFFNGHGLEEESKHSMFKGVGGVLGSAVGTSIHELERLAKTRAGW